MRTILGRVAHGVAGLAFCAVVAAMIADNAPAAPAHDHRCKVRGCLYEPGSDSRALARARDRALDRLGAIDLDKQVPD